MTPTEIQTVIDQTMQQVFNLGMEEGRKQMREEILAGLGKVPGSPELTSGQKAAITRKRNKAKKSKPQLLKTQSISPQKAHWLGLSKSQREAKIEKMLAGRGVKRRS